jgi:hypothetical protein
MNTSGGVKRCGCFRASCFVIADLGLLCYRSWPTAYDTTESVIMCAAARYLQHVSTLSPQSHASRIGLFGGKGACCSDSSSSHRSTQSRWEAQSILGGLHRDHPAKVRVSPRLSGAPSAACVSTLLPHYATCYHCYLLLPQTNRPTAKGRIVSDFWRSRSCNQIWLCTSLSDFSFYPTLECVVMLVHLSCPLRGLLP